MPAYINAIGTAVPNSKISQSKIATYMKQHIEFNEKQSHHLDVIYRASGIDYRYSILPDFHQTTKTSGFIMPGREPSLYDRMKLYEIEAPVLIGGGSVVDGRNLKLQGYENGYYLGGCLFDQVKKDKKAKILVGGNYSKKLGYFIEPTVIDTTDPKYTTMCEEIFGPVLTIYTYPAAEYEKTLKLLDSTSKYALTGAIIAQDRSAIELATKLLRHAAGNFYINDKPTGAVVGQQPFGGARASGTNDKAGSMLNLYRWLSARTIKETFNPPTDYTYPFLKEA